MGSKVVPGDGVYRVGRDIPPGRYSTTAGDSHCTWWVAKSASRKKPKVEAGKLVNGTGHVHLPSGAFFATHECTPWRREGSPTS